MKADTTDSSYS